MTRRHPITRTRAKTLRRAMTEPEKRLWARLRASQTGIKFQRQVVLAPYIADFAARSERLVIEIDGDSHVGQESYDAARTAGLESRGYRVLRFTNADVMGNIDGVLRAILIAVGRDPDAPLTEDPLTPALSP
ncbi:MAG: DUF559 domain-containing protein [Pseudomonadota bacterium]